MSGEVSGVQKRIKTIYPAARYYVHCRSHQLQLVIVNSCKNFPHIGDAIAILAKKSCLFNQNRSSMNDYLKLISFQGLTHYPGQ